jgi:hypothetical protein
VNILDENIDLPQRQRLDAWKIHYRRIGVWVGRFGMKDHDEIIPLLHQLHRPTFFTRDHDFYHPVLRHAGYCLVHLDVMPDEAAEYIRHLLRHRTFRTHAQRMGKVVRVRHSGLTYWQEGSEIEYLTLRRQNQTGFVQPSSDGFPVRVDRPAVGRLVQRREDGWRPFQRPCQGRLEPVPRGVTTAPATEPSPLKRAVKGGDRRPSRDTAGLVTPAGKAA